MGNEAKSMSSNGREAVVLMEGIAAAGAVVAWWRLDFKSFFRAAYIAFHSDLMEGPLTDRLVGSGGSIEMSALDETPEDKLFNAKARRHSKILEELARTSRFTS